MAGTASSTTAPQNKADCDIDDDENTGDESFHIR